jgi:hypothetical protein
LSFTEGVAVIGAFLAAGSVVANVFFGAGIDNALEELLAVLFKGFLIPNGEDI